MLKNESGLTLVMLVVIIVILISCSICGYLYMNKSDVEIKETSSDSNENILDELVSENYIETNKSLMLSSELNEFSGIYTNDKNSIEISRIGVDSFSVKIDENEIYNLIAENENVISLDNKITDQEFSITITKIDDEIEIKANAKDDDSILNNIDGTFKKEYKNDLVWNNVYKNGETYIILSEIKDVVNVSINKEDDVYVNYTSDFSDDYISIEEELFDDKNVIEIKKNSKGIILEANSTDEESFLNKISGEYEMQF